MAPLTASGPPQSDPRTTPDPQRHHPAAPSAPHETPVHRYAAAPPAGQRLTHRRLPPDKMRHIRLQGRKGLALAGLLPAVPHTQSGAPLCPELACRRTFSAPEHRYARNNIRPSPFPPCLHPRAALSCFSSRFLTVLPRRFLTASHQGSKIFFLNSRPSPGKHSTHRIA